jgi:hypothetical protein
MNACTPGFNGRHLTKWGRAGLSVPRSGSRWVVWWSHVGCVVLVCDSDLLRHCPGGRRLCDQAQPAEQAQGPGTQRSAPRRRRGRSPGSRSRPSLAMSCKPQSRRMRRARRRRRPSESGSARWGWAPIGSTCCARAQTSSSRAVGPGCGRASSTCGGRSTHISQSIPSRPTGGWVRVLAASAQACSARRCLRGKLFTKLAVSSLACRCALGRVKAAS